MSGNPSTTALLDPFIPRACFVIKPSHVEGFQPQAHWSPTTPLKRILFYLRLTADLQTNSIYRDLRQHLKAFSGKLLDIGCGNSPFRHLLDPAISEYRGIDVPEASSFGYQNPDTVYYDGRVIPFPDESFDALLCTEVLEHVVEPVELIQEMHRVLKPGGLALVTIPWSARFHYKPYDYYRYTPSALETLFQSFGSQTIYPRGTDLSSIASKIVVCYLRNVIKLKGSKLTDCLLFPIRLVCSVITIPILVGGLVLGHCGIYFSLGSTDDPLGYTIVIRR
jgi:SAM-dependent methyltransferase